MGRTDGEKASRTIHLAGAGHPSQARGLGTGYQENGTISDFQFSTSTVPMPA